MIPMTFSEIAAVERRRELHEAARRARRVGGHGESALRAFLRRFGAGTSSVPAASHASVTIHLARPEDMPSLRRLAALDSAPLPETPLLVGRVEGEPRAALGLRSRTSVADPFQPSAWLVSLLALRAVQLWPQPPDERGSSPATVPARVESSRPQLRAV